MTNLLHPINYQGYILPTKAFPLVAALLLWAVLMLLAIVWPRRRRGWTLDVLTVLATIVLGVAWQQAFYATQRPEVAKETISVCATVEPGMRAADLTSKAGKPDRILQEAETRGPGATVWVYDKSRCAVHLLLDTVEYTE